MDYLADSPAKLCQGGKGQYVGKEGVSKDTSSGEKYEPVVVFESLDLSVCHRVYVSLCSGVWNKVILMQG